MILVFHDIYLNPIDCVLAKRGQNVPEDYK
jgi:hypothetical protein